LVTIPPMELSQDVWAFVIALAAVVNGLGIVRLLSSFAEYLKRREAMEVGHYWVFALVGIFQFLLHLLLWWSVLGLKAANNINFLSYLYLLIGPTLLFLATNLLLPGEVDDELDLRKHYYEIRKPYYSVLLIFWPWTMFIWPVFGYPFAPTVPVMAVLFLLNLGLRTTANQKVHAALVVANLIVYAAFVSVYAMNLGEVGLRIVE